MAAGDREVLERAFAAVSRGDWETWEECWHPEGCYHDQSGAFAPDLPRVSEGREAVKAFSLAWAETFAGLHFELESLEQAGDALLTTGRWRGTGHDSGVPVELAESIVWRFRDGLIVEGRAFSTPRQALEEALGDG